MATASPQPETSTSTSNAASPPPNCAICLGNCINKCFSDSCMHQFCFKCLLEWSKVKAVCPLCKQPFTSIIHNVKSNNEYDEHFIETDTNNIQEATYQDFMGGPADRQGFGFFVTPASRHFQFRTTFTVDPRGELAIQQLLSTHPLTNSFHLSIPPASGSYLARQHFRRFQSDYSSSHFRRYIYEEDMWVYALPDITGRYRDISPQYYRENPAARNRLVPWLNRELNALLLENTQHVMYVVDVILSQLDRHHITSRYFNQLLEEYLGNRTGHFIHEFYNFMRSPYDMIGYDRQVFYSPSQFLRIDSSDDSDVVIVPTNETAEPVVIEIDSDSSRDSVVILREPSPPVVVNLVDSDSNDTVRGSESDKPILPLKIRLKRKRQSREKRSKRRTRTDKNSSDSESTFSSTNESDASYIKIKSKKKNKRSKYYIIKNSDSDSDTDNEPILNRLKKEREERKRKKVKKASNRRKQRNFMSSRDRHVSKMNGVLPNIPKESLCKNECIDTDHSGSYTPPPRLMPILKNEFSNFVVHEEAGLEKDFIEVIVREEEVAETSESQNRKSQVEHDTISNENGVELNNPGPSGNSSLINHEPMMNTWYSRPPIFSSDDDSD